MSLDFALPDDWHSWDSTSKDRLLHRLKAEAILQGKVETFCTFETPSAMAKHYLGDRWHHRDYHDELDRLALDLRAGTVDRAAISQPPQTGKSTAVNWLIFWWQAMNPTHPIMRVSYAGDLAISHANYVHRLVVEHGGAFGLVPQRGAQKQNNWETLTGTGLRSGGILTGMSGFPAALMVIDDPLAGRAQADSKLIRDKTWSEISGSLISRMRPNAPLLYVLTRWHEDDPVGRAVKQEGSEAEGGRYRVLNLPAIDADGAPLQHPWIEPSDVRGALKHWEDKRRTSTLRDWHSLYQGDPKPVEGALLTDEQVKAATHNGELPEFVRTGVAIDPSGGGRDVAGIVGGGVTANGKVIWTHDISGQMGSDEWTRGACILAHELDANEIVYERNFGADTAKFLLRSVWKGLSEAAVAEGKPDWGPCPRIVEVHAKKGKRVRAEPIAVQVQLGNISFWALNVLDLGSEWCAWQESSSESPGRIDASAYLAYRWLKIPGAEANVSTIGLHETPKAATGKGALAGRRVARPAAGR